jgi:fructose-specific phosphotransferase system IIA component
MEIFSTELVKTHYYAFDKKSLLREMVEFLSAKEIISDEESFLQAIFARENLMSTGIGKQVAIPHARHISIQELKIAVFQLDNEIDFDAIDKKTVKLVMMICIPEAMKKEYMQVLGKISNFFQSEDNRSKLFSAENPDEMITILKGIEI